MQQIYKWIGVLLTAFLLTYSSSFAQTPGNLDLSFDPGTGPNNTTGTPTISVIAMQPDGKILLGGDFETFNGVNYNNIVRLNNDGSIDLSFNVGTGFTYPGNFAGINSIEVQPDNKILVGGTFSNYNGVNEDGLVKLNTDGTLDTSFSLALTAPSPNALHLTSIKLQSDGKILLAGKSLMSFGSNSEGITRINSDGSIDPTFSFTTSFFWGDINEIALQTDGKIIIGGVFSVSSLNLYSLGRLLPNGNKDNTFSTGSLTSGPNIGEINSITIQSDGKIIFSGVFDLYNGISRNHIMRINTDGTADMSYNPNPGSIPSTPYQNINTAHLQANNRMFIGGLPNFNGTVYNPTLDRINEDGTQDLTFVTGTGVGRNGVPGQGSISSSYIQPDGKILIGGYFTDYNGVTRNGVARIHGDVVTGLEEEITSPTSANPNPTSSSLTFTYPTLQTSAQLTLTDALGRTVHQQTVAQGSTQHSTNLAHLPEAVYFYQLTTKSGSLGSGKVAVVR